MTIKDKIEAALQNAGLSDRIGQFYGTCGHHCGLPQQEMVFVRPDWSPIDGAHTIVVTAEVVSTYGCRYPSNHCNWNLHCSMSYSTPDEMVSLVSQAVGQPKGCW
jgi:hypothetical protein